MYIAPHDHKCPKCGHEMKYGPHEGYNSSPLTQRGNPLCPVCWDEFISKLGIEMLCTVEWSPKGSEFTQATGMVKDRKTGEWYKPEAKFDALLNSPSFKDTMNRMKDK